MGEAMLNSFRCGLDNRIHGQTAGNGGLLVPGDKSEAKPLDVNGRDFFFDPRSLAIGAETGGGTNFGGAGGGSVVGTGPNGATTVD